MTPQQANQPAAYLQESPDKSRHHLSMVGVMPPDPQYADWTCTPLYRRAPAPTEPAVDRDVVLEEAAEHVESLIDSIGDAAAYDNREMRDDEMMKMHYNTTVANSIRSFKLATPASPAPAPLAPYDALFKAIAAGTVVAGNAVSVSVKDFTAELAKQGYAVAPQLPQASQPTTTAYIPKPPPPRPQRPIGPAWTDAEREEYRKNMKRGERCPECSVIEGGGHFSGCPRGK